MSLIIILQVEVESEKDAVDFEEEEVLGDAAEDEGT